MTDQESNRLARIEQDVKHIKERDYSSSFVTMMVFMMWLSFVMDGCSFK